MQREQKTSTLIFYGDKYFLFLNFFYFLIIGSRSYKKSILIILVFYFSSFIFPFSSFVDSSFWEFFFWGGGEFILRNPLSFTLSSMLSLRWRREGGCKIFIYRGVKLVNLPEFRYSSATITTLLPPIAAERFLIYILLNSE